MKSPDEAGARRLAGEASPYLRSAASQAVEWYAWGSEAFERAQREDKPILLDIGAAWCHWCHVIDHESYEDAQTADIINKHFVPIKVDRDERPDIDARYQHAVQAISGQGGWPLTAFLTPDGRVFFGGTYFPPVDSYGRPSFKRVLLSVAQYYRDNKEEVEKAAREIYQQIAPALAPAASGEISAAMVSRAIDDIARAFDATNGGFGRAPKFPHPGTIDLLIRRAWGTGDERLLAMVARTLEKMGRGGVYDQIGGGFHRYATDAQWIVPHFEKMLYDNAGLLANYVRAFQLTGNGFFREIALGTYGYMRDVLYDHERGGFAGSQDADIGPHDDGDYYTWTVDEARAALSEDEFRVAVLQYDVDERGEMHHDPRRNVLFIARDPDVIATITGLPVARVGELLASARTKLLDVRRKRRTPFVDRTVYSNWNGMAVTAYLEVFKAVGLAEARSLALRALDRILREGYRPGHGVLHMLTAEGAAHAGLLDDQVQVAAACLDAFEVTGERRYLAAAADLADYMIREHRDPAGGFADVARSKGTDSMLASTVNKPIQDSPTPAANAVAAMVLTRLARVLDQTKYRQAAEDTLGAFAGGLAGFGLYASTYFLALDDFLTEPAHIVIVAGRENGAAAELHTAALRTFRPGKIVGLFTAPSRATDGGADQPALPEPVRAMAAATSSTQAFVCAGTSCAPPTDDAARLADLIRTFNTGRAGPSS